MSDAPRRSGGLFSVLMATLIGVAVGLIIAPHDGRRTRLRLLYQLERLGKKAFRIMDDLPLPDVEHASRKEGEAVIEDARKRARDIEEELERLKAETTQKRKSAPTATK